MSGIVITPLNHGPLYVKGPMKIVTEGGKEIAVEGEEAWLCRCGQSAKKPFCDGAHKKAGFRSNLDEQS
jgi:CDGSH-type Zn-finger protein